MANTDPLKRRSKRIKDSLLLRFRVKGEPDWNMVLTNDLSSNGVYFRYNKRLETGTIIDLKINLPTEDKAITCTARVVRSEVFSNSRITPIFGIAATFVDTEKKS